MRYTVSFVHFALSAAPCFPQALLSIASSTIRLACPTRRCRTRLFKNKQLVGSLADDTKEVSLAKDSGEGMEHDTLSVHSAVDGPVEKVEVAGGAGGDIKDSGGSGGEGPGDNEQSGENERKGSDDRNLVLGRLSSTKDNMEKMMRSVTTFLKEELGAIINHVPAQVLVAGISVTSTIVGTQYKRKLDKELERKQRIHEETKRRQAVQDRMHALFQDYTGPILKTSSKLAERLFEVISSPKEALAGADDSLYTAYLIGRYLGVIEMLKYESTNLDFGFPAADRIFLNIIGRIQGVWGAENAALARIQKSERSFAPASGSSVLDAGALQVSPHTQIVCGELMLSRKWGLRKSEGADKGMKAMITYLEFTELMKSENAMSKWFQPIVDELEAIHVEARKNDYKNMRQLMGARIFILQSALCDLVEFLDPSPRCRFVARHCRARLTLSEGASEEVQRTPASLQAIYKQLQNIRDEKVEEGKFAASKCCLEVYVRGVYADESKTFVSNEHGDCPYSQRVLITLEEMGVPYKVVPIFPDEKPSWFHLLNANGQVPVIVHDGYLVEDSRQIVSYLMNQFPRASKRISSTDHLKLRSGTAGFTQFFPKFASWISGAPGATQEDVEKELEKLDGVLARVQCQQKGPFLGGKRFSREDTAIAPFLHHVSVAGPRVGNLAVADKYPAIRKYLEACFDRPSFVKTKSADHTIEKGYRRLTSQGHETAVRLPDLLD